jgi:O-antigen/teichoic acid export membrane protein
LIARLLGPELQGEWALYINGYVFGSIALGFGLPPAINHYVAARKLEKQTLISQMFFFVLCVAVVFVLIVFGLGFLPLGKVFLPEFGNRSFVLAGMTLHFVLLLFNQMLSATLIAEKKYSISAKISGVFAFLLFVGYGGLYLLGETVSNIFFYLFIILNLIVLFIQTLLTLRAILANQDYTIRFAFPQKKLLSTLVTFAFLAYVANFIQFLNYKMDVWFISAFDSNKDDLGIYAVAVSLSQLIWLIPNAFHTVIFTEISEGKKNNEKERIYNWSKKIFLFALIAAVIGFVLSLWLLPIIFGEQYEFVLVVFPYILPGVVIFAPSILWSAYFAGKNRIDINLKSSIIGFVVALVGGYFVIRSYGIIGAAMVATISYSLTSLYSLWQFNKMS